MKENVTTKKQEIIQLVSGICDQKINSEYKELSIKLIEKMARKQTVPFMSGKIAIWAAAVIYALGQINFLFDKNNDPYLSTDDICEFFQTTKSTTSQKAKVIRDMFELDTFDPDFSTKSVLEQNPANDMVVINGLYVSKDMAIEKGWI